MAVEDGRLGFLHHGNKILLVTIHGDDPHNIEDGLVSRDGNERVMFNLGPSCDSDIVSFVPNEIDVVVVDQPKNNFRRIVVNSPKDKGIVLFLPTGV